jgi:hypothetical protein
VETETPQEIISRPGEALSLDRLPSDAGRLWALSRARSLDWLHVTLATTRRFRASLDLGAINERRAAIFAGTRWSGSHLSRPVFGRGWWLPGDEAHRREVVNTLGALDDRFVLLETRGGTLDASSLVADVEAAVDRRWREQHLQGTVG